MRTILAAPLINGREYVAPSLDSPRAPLRADRGKRAYFSHLNRLTVLSMLSASP